MNITSHIGEYCWSVYHLSLVSIEVDPSFHSISLFHALQEPMKIRSGHVHFCPAMMSFKMRCTQCPLPNCFMKLDILPSSGISNNSQMDDWVYHREVPTEFEKSMFTCQFHYLLGTEWQNDWQLTGNDINNSGKVIIVPEIEHSRYQDLQSDPVEVVK